MPDVESPAFTLPCVVCAEPVILASDAPEDERANPLCILHWFTDDPTAPWEVD